MSDTPRQPTIITNPVFIMLRHPNEHLVTHIHPPSDWNHKHYGLAICDLVRHCAHSLKCDPEDIWEWVDKERDRSTTDITRAS